MYLNIANNPFIMLVEINVDKYDELKMLSKEELAFIMSVFVDVGYKRLFSSKNKEESLLLYEKLDKITECLNPLMNNSSKKGKFNEGIMENFFLQGFKGYHYTSTKHIPHYGDGTLEKGTFRLMVEFKNYSNTVTTQEVQKLKRDMVENGFNYGLLVSANSGVANKSDFDLEVFDTNRFIISVSKVISLDRWDLVESAVQLLEKMYTQKEKQILSEYLSNKLQSLNCLLVDIEKITQEFYDVEAKIKQNLDGYSTTLHRSTKNMKSLINEICTIPNEIVFDTEHFEQLQSIYPQHSDILRRVSVLLHLNRIDYQVLDSEIDVKKGKIKIIKTKVSYHNISPPCSVDINLNTWHQVQPFLEQLWKD